LGDDGHPAGDVAFEGEHVCGAGFAAFAGNFVVGAFVEELPDTGVKEVMCAFFPFLFFGLKFYVSYLYLVQALDTSS
jgi:hypothetical protein